MKIGIISDSHGNPDPFFLAINYLISQKVDRIIFLGDVVGYLTEPVPILNWLIENNVDCVMGNHDAMLLGLQNLDAKKDEVYQIEPIRKKLSDSHINFISDWKPFILLTINNKKLFFVHGSPWGYLNEYIYPDSNLERFKELDYDVIFMGHTHRPFIQKYESKLIVNVGSTGLPRDAGNFSSCCIYDSEINQITIYRFQFDEEKIIQKYESNIHQSVINCLYGEEINSGRND